MTSGAFLFWAPGSHPTSLGSGTSWRPHNNNNNKKMLLWLPALLTALWARLSLTNDWWKPIYCLTPFPPEQSWDSVVKYHRLKVRGCCPSCPFHTVPGSGGAWIERVMVSVSPASELTLGRRSSVAPARNKHKGKMSICNRKRRRGMSDKRLRFWICALAKLKLANNKNSSVISLWGCTHLCFPTQIRCAIPAKSCGSNTVQRAFWFFTLTYSAKVKTHFSWFTPALPSTQTTGRKPRWLLVLQAWCANNPPGATPRREGRGWWRALPRRAPGDAVKRRAKSLAGFCATSLQQGSALGSRSSRQLCSGRRRSVRLA